jgi:hypothetical protein
MEDLNAKTLKMILLSDFGEGLEGILQFLKVNSKLKKPRILKNLVISFHTLKSLKKGIFSVFERFMCCKKFNNRFGLNAPKFNKNRWFYF